MMVSALKPILFMSPVLGAGYIRFNFLSSLLPAKFTLTLGGVPLRTFYLRAFWSRRHLPYVKVPFRSYQFSENLDYAVRINVLGRLFIVQIPRGSVRWSSSGQIKFFVKGEKFEVPWTLRPRSAAEAICVGKGVAGRRVFALSHKLSGLDRQITSQLEASRGKTNELIRDQIMLRRKDLTQPIWLIGNSPNVRVEDLEKIPRSNTVLAMNRFYLSYESHCLREDILVSSDPMVIRDFGEEMIEKSSGAAIFVSDKKCQESGRALHIPLRKDRHEFVSLELDHGLHPFGSTFIASMQIAMSLGFKRINLYGVDLSFVIKPDSDRSGMEVGGENHFIPGYRSSKPWTAPDWIRIQEGILACGIAAEAQKVCIRNYTPGHKFDFFERGYLETRNNI